MYYYTITSKEFDIDLAEKEGKKRNSRICERNRISRTNADKTSKKRRKADYVCVCMFNKMNINAFLTFSLPTLIGTCRASQGAEVVQTPKLIPATIPYQLPSKSFKKVQERSFISRKALISVSTYSKK